MINLLPQLKDFCPKAVRLLRLIWCGLQGYCPNRFSKCRVKLQPTGKSKHTLRVFIDDQVIAWLAMCFTLCHHIVSHIFVSDTLHIETHEEWHFVSLCFLYLTNDVL